MPSFAKVGNYAEWYWNTLTRGDDGETQAFHNRTYGPTFRYQDFAPMWKAELFNATEWAELFRRSGARYIVPTSKHHEGFTLWPSAQAWNWNAVDIGPHRDLLGEIMEAVRGAGLHAGMYFSLYEWFHPFYLSNVTKYVDEILQPQFRDLIDNYKPDILWCDGEWEQTSTTWRALDFLTYLFNDSPVKDDIVINDRFGSDTRGTHGGFYTAEYSAAVFDHKWEENSGIDVFSFGLNRQTRADQYWSTPYLLNLLMRSVSNGGNLLLDIGPRSDGTIPTIMQERLLDIGAWLDVNGEGVYGSHKWRSPQEGTIDNTTVRYTQGKDQAVYAFLLTWPATPTITLTQVAGTTGQGVVTLLGWNGGELSWVPGKNQTGGATTVITLPVLTPNTTPCQHIWTLKLVNFS